MASLKRTVETTKGRMDRASVAAVKAAVKAGSKPISLARHYRGGPLVLTVAVPESWRALEAWHRAGMTVSCVVPADREEATQDWFARQVG